LAFNSAVAISEFLLDTWHARRAAEASGGLREPWQAS